MSEERNESMEEKKQTDSIEKAIIKEANQTELPSVESIEKEIEIEEASVDEELVTESISVIEGAKGEEKVADTGEEEKDPVMESLSVIEETKKEPEVADNDEDEDFADDDEEHEDEVDQNDIESALNEHSEDEEAAERHNIPKKDYEKLSKEDLIKEFKSLMQRHKVQAIKEHVDEIRSAFISQFEEEQEEAKEKFLEEGGNIIDFRYYSPLKKEFNTLYFEYREKRNNYYKNLKKDLNANLDNRNHLIEELKNLKDELGGEDSINTTYEKFKDIQERWRNAGNIPRDRYNLVWNNYHHHVENFYDFLHLNREFRDIDFKHNLDKKLKLIEQAEELTKEQDVNRSFRELQMLHKIWKEEVGPVAREYREEIWNKFSAATKKIHEARQDYFKNIDKIYEENLLKKQEVIKKIEEKAETVAKSHNAWQNQMKQVEALRDDFFAIGRVPRKSNEDTWKAFKKATRTFNRNKNAFYKNQKKEQYENLNKKMELVKIAEDNKDNEDKETTTELMKKIQSDWKKIGHVPRKDSDKIWKRFKKACNDYFDSLHASKNEALEEEKANLKQKQELLETFKSYKPSGEAEADLKSIKETIKLWKEIGRVPYSKKNIEQDFNKVLDGLFKKLDLSRKESELIKYDNRVAAMADRDDDHQINKERYFITKKIDEVKSEIFQLENNLGFFQHVADDNPMVKEVHQNIANHKKTLEIWKAKLKKLKTLY